MWPMRNERPEPGPVPKVKVRTVAVVATTQAPDLGFRVSGRRVELCEEIRVPADDAADLVKRGKCKIVPGSEAEEMR